MVDTDVLIAGAGPIGLTAAIELARRGIDFRIVDPITDPPQYAVGYVGVYLVFFTIPSDFPTGTDLPLAVQIVLNGNGVFGNQTFLPGVN